MNDCSGEGFFFFFCRVDATQGWISAGEQTYFDLFRSKAMTDRDYCCIFSSFPRNFLPNVAVSRDSICHLAISKEALNLKTLSLA